MVFTETSHVIAQRGVPTGVVTIAIGQGGVVVALAVGVTAVPALTLAPVTAQEEFALSHKSRNNLPGQGVVHTNAIAVVDVLVVVENSYGIVVVLRVGTTHAEVAGNTRT